MRARLAATAASLVAAAIVVPACGGGGDGSAGEQTQTTVSTAARSGFSTRITHPLVPLRSVPYTAFRGTDGKKKTSGSNQLLKRTKVVDGVRTAVLLNKEYENGKIVERTYDYFAQRSDGSVWYFGELVDNYENGKVNHEGQWLAGVGENKPGLYMPVKPKVGQVFDQEKAPGVAEDRSTVLKVGITKKTPAGTFKRCIKVKDFSPIDKLNEFKFYCRGIGLVHEDEPGAHSSLVSYKRAR